MYVAATRYYSYYFPMLVGVFLSRGNGMELVFSNHAAKSACFRLPVGACVGVRSSSGPLLPAGGGRDGPVYLLLLLCLVLLLAESLFLILPCLIVLFPCLCLS